MSAQPKYVSPSVKATAFNCAHCGTLTTQFWYSLRGEYNKNGTIPFIIGQAEAEERYSEIKDEEQKEKAATFLNMMASGRPFLEQGGDGDNARHALCNVNACRCYECKEISIWIYDKLVYPQRGEAPAANADLPPDILKDYNEASSILDLSPRGAAALVRLCIQKLCKHLGQSGDNINADIGALVAAGLDSRIQKALDVVRVIGNNAVHPGAMDLSDDRPTAETLFRLVNVIAEKMISEPKHIDEIYGNLPPKALAGIVARDKKTTP